MRPRPFDVRPERQGEPDDDPDDAHERQPEEAVHRGREDVLPAHEAAVEQREARQHHHHERGRHQHPGGVARVDLATVGSRGDPGQGRQQRGRRHASRTPVVAPPSLDTPPIRDRPGLSSGRRAEGGRGTPRVSRPRRVGVGPIRIRRVAAGVGGTRRIGLGGVERPVGLAPPALASTPDRRTTRPAVVPCTSSVMSTIPNTAPVSRSRSGTVAGSASASATAIAPRRPAQNITWR